MWFFLSINQKLWNQPNTHQHWMIFNRLKKQLKFSATRIKPPCDPRAITQIRIWILNNSAPITEPKGIVSKKPILFHRLTQLIIHFGLKFVACTCVRAWVCRSRFSIRNHTHGNTIIGKKAALSAAPSANLVSTTLKRTNVPRNWQPTPKNRKIFRICTICGKNTFCGTT